MIQREMPDHECEKYLILHDGEAVCGKCGIVVREPDADAHVDEAVARAMITNDHNAGNPLLLTQTQNTGYQSKKNMGLAFDLNGGGKDYQGRRVKSTLNDPYTAGNLVDKELVMKVDPLTGEGKLRFDMYSKPYYDMLKQRLFEMTDHRGLSYLDLHYIEREAKRVTGNLFFSELLDLGAMAAILNSGVLKPKDAQKMEREYYAILDEARLKLMVHCDVQRVKELKKVKREESRIKA